MRVIVVEDDSETRLALFRFLDSSGYAVTVTGSALEAMSHIDHQTPDVVILDWDLGTVLSGVHVATYLRERSTVAKIIFITGNSLAELKENTPHLGGAEYLRKPFGLQDIRIVLNAVNSETP